MPIKSKVRVKRVTRKFEAFGILNRFGEFWTPNAFDSVADAKKYMKDFWGKNPNPPSMSHHKIVPITGVVVYTLPSKKR